MTWTSAVLAERLGGDEALARELVEIFLAEYSQLLDALRASVARGEARAIRRSAHALKGSIANFIDDGPTATALAIEFAADESRLDDMPVLMAQLEREILELVVAMRDLPGDARCAS